jgi:hypothetical protein
MSTTTIITASVPEENIYTRFKVKHTYSDNDDLIDAIRKNTKKWLTSTKAGKDAWRQTSEDFNWGDLAEYDNIPLPKGILSFELIPNEDSEIVVDHDEILGQ